MEKHPRPFSVELVRPHVRKAHVRTLPSGRTVQVESTNVRGVTPVAQAAFTHEITMDDVTRFDGRFGPVRELVDETKRYNITNVAEPVDRLPFRAVTGGKIVTMQLQDAPLRVAQHRVCGGVMHRKIANQDTCSISVVPHGDHLYVIDGHHSLAIANIAQRQNLFDGNVSAYVYEPSTSGDPIQTPQLDCDCH